MNKTLIISFFCISSIMMKINGAAPYDPTQQPLQQAIGRCDAPAVVACLQANPRVTTATMQTLHKKIAQVQQATASINTFLTASGPRLDRQQLNELQAMTQTAEYCNRAISTMLPLLTRAYKATVE
ncbi:MAG TPA: hypothetical protein VGT41_01200 [Candidatus Babeliales bacterium]|nr:hypothetical protein [Candidatus Babeliales bacterium]